LTKHCNVLLTSLICVLEYCWGAVVLWCWGAVVLGCWGAVVLGCWGAVVLWCCGAVVLSDDGDDPCFASNITPRSTCANQGPFTTSTFVKGGREVVEWSGVECTRRLGVRVLAPDCRHCNLRSSILNGWRLCGLAVSLADGSSVLQVLQEKASFVPPAPSPTTYRPSPPPALPTAWCASAFGPGSFRYRSVRRAITRVGKREASSPRTPQRNACSRPSITRRRPVSEPRSDGGRAERNRGPGTGDRASLSVDRQCTFKICVHEPPPTNDGLSRRVSSGHGMMAGPEPHTLGQSKTCIICQSVIFVFIACDSQTVVVKIICDALINYLASLFERPWPLVPPFPRDPTGYVSLEVQSSSPL